MNSLIYIGILAVLFGSISVSIFAQDVCPKNFILPPPPLWYQPQLCMGAICQCRDINQTQSYSTVCSVDCACNHGKIASHCDFTRHVCICEGANLTDVGYCVENKVTINALIELTFNLLEDNKDPSTAIDSLVYATNNSITDLNYLKVIVCELTLEYPLLYIFYLLMNCS